ncbi:MAG TPA: divalent-cation tolerance protein CutA [Vicinamibacterales bacterium]|jgi:periplasmic divalent cation tolerance protein
MDQLERGATDVVIALTTWPAAHDPAAFAGTLVEERLAACVNVLPEMESVYRWRGRVERERERQVIIKTTRARVEALIARVGQLHPYEVPELVVLASDGGGPAYLDWVRGETSSLD